MFEEISQKLESDFKAAWVDVGGGVKVKYVNVPFAQPKGDGAEFISFTVVGGDGELGSIGSLKREAQFGMVVIQIFTPKNKGTKRSKQLGDYAAAIFRYQQVRQGDVEITFHQAPRLQTTGDRADFFQENLIMPFRAIKLFTVT